MVTITDEIIEKLKSNNFSIKVEDVREPYSSKDPVYPMIIVEETRNTPYLQLHGELILSTINYRFEIYGRDISVDETLLSRRKVVTQLGNDLDSIMRETYGMKIVGTPQILRYGKDGSILRYIVTYGGIIDNKTMLIYQK